MNVTTSHHDGVVVLRVHEPRLTYPILADFATAATEPHRQRREADPRRPDARSATWTAPRSAASWTCTGRPTAAGGALKLAGVQKRVETMLTMTGAHNFLEVHADQASALASFGG